MIYQDERPGDNDEKWNAAKKKNNIVFQISRHGKVQYSMSHGKIKKDNLFLLQTKQVFQPPPPSNTCS